MIIGIALIAQCSMWYKKAMKRKLFGRLSVSKRAAKNKPMKATKRLRAAKARAALFECVFMKSLNLSFKRLFCTLPSLV